MAAIYMWMQRDLQVFTTTLYPLEVIDAVQFQFDISSASMSPIPQDSLTLSANLIAVTLNQILLSYGPGQDELDISANLIGVILNQILLSYGPGEDELDISADLIEVELLQILVTADTPDEKLQLAFDINATGWLLTPA